MVVDAAPAQSDMDVPSPSHRPGARVLPPAMIPASTTPQESTLREFDARRLHREIETEADWPSASSTRPTADTLPTTPRSTTPTSPHGTTSRKVTVQEPPTKAASPSRPPLAKDKPPRPRLIWPPPGHSVPRLPPHFQSSNASDPLPLMDQPNRLMPAPTFKTETARALPDQPHRVIEPPTYCTTTAATQPDKAKQCVARPTFSTTTAATVRDQPNTFVALPTLTTAPAASSSSHAHPAASAALAEAPFNPFFTTSCACCPSTIQHALDRADTATSAPSSLSLQSTPATHSVYCTHTPSAMTDKLGHLMQDATAAITQPLELRQKYEKQNRTRRTNFLKLINSSISDNYEKMRSATTTALTHLNPHVPDTKAPHVSVAPFTLPQIVPSVLLRPTVVSETMSAEQQLIALSHSIASETGTTLHWEDDDATKAAATNETEMKLLRIFAIIIDEQSGLTQVDKVCSHPLLKNLGLRDRRIVKLVSSFPQYFTLLHKGSVVATAKAYKHGYVNLEGDLTNKGRHWLDLQRLISTESRERTKASKDKKIADMMLEKLMRACVKRLQMSRDLSLTWQTLLQDPEVQQCHVGLETRFKQQLSIRKFFAHGYPRHFSCVRGNTVNDTSFRNDDLKITLRRVPRAHPYAVPPENVNQIIANTRCGAVDSMACEALKERPQGDPPMRCRSYSIQPRRRTKRRSRSRRGSGNRRRNIRESRSQNERVSRSHSRQERRSRNWSESSSGSSSGSRRRRRSGHGSRDRNRSRSKRRSRHRSRSRNRRQSRHWRNRRRSRRESKSRSRVKKKSTGRSSRSSRSGTLKRKKSKKTTQRKERVDVRKANKRQRSAGSTRRKKGRSGRTSTSRGKKKNKRNKRWRDRKHETIKGESSDSGSAMFVSHKTAAAKEVDDDEDEETKEAEEEAETGKVEEGEEKVEEEEGEQGGEQGGEDEGERKDEEEAEEEEENDEEGKNEREKEENGENEKDEEKQEEEQAEKAELDAALECIVID